MSEARERLIEALAFPIGDADVVDAFLSRPDDLLAVLVESIGLDEVEQTVADIREARNAEYAKRHPLPSYPIDDWPERRGSLDWTEHGEGFAG